MPRVVWVPLSIAVTLGGCGSRSEVSMATPSMAGPRPIGGGPNSGSPDTGSWAFVTAGGSHTCAISRQGRLACWGLNAEQQIGVDCGEINPNTSAPICTRPRWVPGIGAVRYAACGGTPYVGGSTCAIRTDGAVLCWGGNSFGNLGIGREGEPVTSPSLVLDLSAAREVALGIGHGCALLDDGAVYCWGNNAHGQLGLSPNLMQRSPSPRRLELPFRAVSLSAGGDHSCALSEGGSLWCWGANDHGEIGVGFTPRAPRPSSDEPPVPPSELEIADVRRVAAGTRHTCAVTGDGGVFCWGEKTWGMLGLPTEPRGGDESPWQWQPTPALVPNAPSARLLIVAEAHVCASDENGDVWCWGQNANRQVAETPPVMPPTRIGGANQVDGLTAGSNHTCVHTSGGRVLCWGFAEAGQLGVGSTSDRSPTPSEPLEPE